MRHTQPGLGFFLRGLGLYFFAFDVGVTALAFLALIILFTHNFLLCLLYFSFAIALFMNRNMKSCLRSFNIYLLLVAFLFTFGCTSSEARKKKKEQSTVRLHLEVNSDDTGRSGPVKVTHEQIDVNVEKEPFMMEDEVDHASVVDTVGGFAIQLSFSAHGTLKLDMVTTSNKGRRIAILAQFPKSHWLAAPLITKRIATGNLVFTPDCTREEAERFVNGLNNVAEKAKKANSLF